MKMIIWFIITAVIIIVGLLLFSWNRPVLEREQAINFVMDDLENKYPNSEYEILDIKKNMSESGEEFFEIKAKVTLNADTPCPERRHVYYNYPEQGFAVHPPDHITHDCKYCINQPNCVILFDEEAIIASHTLPGTDSVQDYIEEFDPKPNVRYDKDENLWVVTWDSEEAGKFYVVSIHTNNTLESVMPTEK